MKTGKQTFGRVLLAAFFCAALPQLSMAAGTWQQVGAAGFSAGPSPYTSLAIDSGGTPYIAYMDQVNGNKASVMKFSGGSWEQVGQAGFSAGEVGWNISLAIDSSGTPYVAYMDQVNGNKASVMKFSGGSWEQVGQAGFSAGGAWYTGLVIDGSGTLYVAYMDEANNKKTSVMKFNSATSSWEQVGMAGFSAGEVCFNSIAIDSNGTPYIAYADVVNGGKTSVMRYCGPCGCDRSLPANTWLMTAPACQPSPPDIGSQYGDDLSSTYGSTWISYKWDAATTPQAYIQQAGTDPLELGIGNWLYSTGAGTLDISGTATPTEDCTAYGWTGKTCFAIDLVIPPAGQKRWNMVGHPFPYTVSLDNVRVASCSGDCGNSASWTVYTPSDAGTQQLVEKNLHSWNGSSYQTKDDTPVTLGTLQPQEAFWVWSLPDASTLAGLKLLIPAR